MNAPTPSLLPKHPFSDDNDERLIPLKSFLFSAPSQMQGSETGSILRFMVPDTGEYVSCIAWRGQHLITGTDIVRIIQYRFRCKGIKPEKNKKLEEGVFSDLRSLKAGHDALLEEPRSDLLKFLYEHDCIRTQKKQKVFLWGRVDHDRLFYEAMDREIRRYTSMDMRQLLYFQRLGESVGGNMMIPQMTANPQAMTPMLNNGYGMMPMQQQQVQSMQQMQFAPQNIVLPHLMPARPSYQVEKPKSYAFRNDLLDADPMTSSGALETISPSLLTGNTNGNSSSRRTSVISTNGAAQLMSRPVNEDVTALLSIDPDEFILNVDPNSFFS